MADRKERRRFYAGSSIGFGVVLAMIMSWTAHKWIFWVMIHGVLSWLYVIYYLITRDDWTFF